MTTARNAILDRNGRVMFVCARCGEPITTDDFFELGLRLPDNGEAIRLYESYLTNFAFANGDGA